MPDINKTTQEGLEKLRTRLLDLTNRNKLINYTARTGSSVRIVHANSSSVWQSLVDGKKLPFEVVPEPRDERTGAIKVNKPPARDHAKALQWNTSFDLVTCTGSVLRVLHYAEEFDALARKVSSTARTAIEESGTNMLYLVSGFLEWYESDTSDKPHHAPLCLLPVAIERQRPTAGGQIKIHLEYTGEDINPNLSLLEKMRRDFNLELPAQLEDESPSQYFGRLRRAIKVKPRWQIKDLLTVGFFTFGKLLMYNDLDPKSWPTGTALDNHTLVRQLFSGTGVAGTAFAPEHDVDSTESSGDCPSLVYDADSSQHSALIDVRAGRNLVIEGPPGTGKSQTITNIIAGALADGKTVLFVAEKLAALEVVRKRLDEAGLGAFCLELHSHKTQKQALLADIGKRMKSGVSFEAPQDLGHRRKELEDLKERIRQYAQFLAQKHPRLQRSYCELLWARQRWLLQIQDATLAKSLEASITSAEELDRADFERMRLAAQYYARAFQAACPGDTTPWNHPWSWLPNVNLTVPRQAVLVEQLKVHRALIKHSFGIAAGADSILHLRPNQPLLEELDRLAGADRWLPARPSGCPDLLLRASAHTAVKPILEEWIAHRSTVERLRGLLADKVRDIECVLPETTGLTCCSVDAERLGLTHCIGSDVEQRVQAASETLRHVAELKSLLADGLMPQSKVEVQQLETLCGCIENLSAEMISRRTTALGSPGALATIQTAASVSNELSAQRSRLAQEFDLSHLPPIQQIRAAFEIISGAGFWSRWFGSDYKAARALYARLRLDLKPAHRVTMAQQLRMLASWAERVISFEGDTSLRTVAGDLFRGIDTQWQELEAVASWLNKTNTLLPADSRYGAFARDADPPQLLALSRSAVRVRAIAVSLDGHIQPAESLADWQSSLSSFVEDATKIVHLLERCTIKDSVPLSDLPTICNMSMEWSREQSMLEASTSRLLQLGFDEHSLTVGSVQTAVEFLAEAHSCPLWEQHSAILSQQWDDTRQTLMSVAKASEKAASDLRSSAAALANLALSEPGVFCPRVGDDLLAALDRSLANIDQLQNWCEYREARRKLASQGANRFVEVVEEAECQQNGDLNALFEFSFYDSTVRSLFLANPQFDQFRGVELGLLRSRFCEVDEQILKLNRKHVAHRAASRPVPWGNNSGYIKDYTERALIEHEVSKQKRHLPIRRLVTQARRALMALKPCFMMGPLSVAQYLPPADIQFDLVVMDEASQLKPEDAIGCIARAKQVVVVGDPKQLPPTSFFDRLDEEPEDDEVTNPELSESILDGAASVYQPMRRLRWHYRSQHHSLIEFSNREFYEGDLIVVPSACEVDEDLGIRFVHINGRFESRRNQQEALAINKAVIQHMRTFSGQSLGVVAMNSEQREFIETLLDETLQTDPEAIAFQKRWSATTEPFFVKNLENVQGDERDVIFISGTYGPDAANKVYQRFGPINGPNGHRRLNVLFTRAKKRIHLFSSMTASDIVVGPTSSRGVKALRGYLEYARTGRTTATPGPGGSFESDFERAVGEFLRGKGWEIVPQVGVAGFFIDLGVRHPNRPGAYLAGIECDGAAYHSGKSARDRDRLRQSILESQGWKMYRIWSTDWYRDQAVQCERLLQHLADLYTADPGPVRPTPKNIELRNESGDCDERIRARLVELRKSIDEDTPGVRAEAHILRDEMINIFVRHKVSTRDQWFRRVPQPARVVTDLSHVSRYLGEILEIVAATEPNPDKSLHVGESL